MSNWAIIIGVDKYWKSDACLKGAVRDALNMREWLINIDGGAVPARNCYLLLSPTPDSPSLPSGLQILEATYDNIINAIEDFFNRSYVQGENFYFYFSGHGLTSNIGYEDSIIASDFTEILTTKSISLDSLLALFKATSFKRQFFFIDACRNIPWEHEFRISEYPRPRKPAPPIPPQFIMFATSPGIKALEINEAGNERGAFTEALLAGLRGKGKAKAWDVETQQYLVRWDSLFNYVYEEIQKQKLLAGDRFIQEPRQDRASARNENPILCTFPAGSFSKENLDIDIDPRSIAAQTRIDIGDWGEVVEQASAIQALPVRFQLEPRTYSVKGNTPDYKMDKPKYLVDLYEPEMLTVKFIQSPVIGGGPAPASTPVVNFTKGIHGAPRPGALTVRTEDPMIQVEIFDNTGKSLASNLGRVSVANLNPGIYRARSRTPEGSFEEQIVEILPGESETVTLTSPKIKGSTVFSHILNVTDIPVLNGSLTHPSEAIGPAAMVQLSTLLALAGGVVNEEDRGYGHHLRNVGIRAFRDLIGTPADCGLQVLFGIEGEQAGSAPHYLADIKLRCWLLTEPVPAESFQPLPLPGKEGLAEFALPKSPGSYWLSLEMPNQSPVLLSLNLLPGRLALVIVNQETSGKINIYQYSPSLIPEPSGDPISEQARFPILRRLELIQRAYASGNLDQAFQNAWQLLQAKWVEPMAGCLGGYILLKLNQAEKLAIVVNNMTNYYGGLCDSHILKSEYEASQNQETRSEEAMKMALDRGLPIFSDGLESLVTGIEKYHIDHPAVKLAQDVYKNRIRGLLWTAFPMKELKPGQLNPLSIGL